MDLPNHSSLPPETWLEIFSLATSLPIIYTSEARYALGGTIKKMKPMIRTVMVTKRSLVRVCKSWNNLALQIIYASILITHPHMITPLRKTLVESKLGGDIANLGRWTHCLEVLVANEQLARQMYIFIYSLREIIECLPNLAIMTCSFAGNEEYGVGLLPLIGHTCGQSLRIIRFKRCDRSHWRELLNAAPNLREASFPPTYDFEHIPPAHPAPTPILHALKSLAIEVLDSELVLSATEDLPSLGELVLYIGPGKRVKTMRPFFYKYGRNLSKVVIVHRNSLSETQLPNAIRMLVEFCPALVHLELMFMAWRSFTPSLHLPPVQCIYIYCEQAQATTAVYRDLFAALTTVVSAQLKFIRLMDPKVVTNLCVYHRKVFARGNAELIGRGLVLQDREGKTLS